MGLPYTYGLSVTADRPGRATAAMFREQSGTPATDSNEALSTTGAAGTYSEATTSIIGFDGNTVSYDRCHALGHVAVGKLLLTAYYLGFGTGKSTITTTTKRRVADYVGRTTGYAPCVVVCDSRGRGTSTGYVDYVRDQEDRRLCFTSTVGAVGAENFVDQGRGRVVIGYSTGCLDALLDLCRNPDEILAVVLIVPNFDVGADPIDGYWGLSATAVRNALINQVGDRAQGSAAALDPYIARNAIDGTARILDLPGAPPVWIFGDRTEAPLVPITGPDRLVRALQATPKSSSLVHAHITQAGDPARYLHDTGTLDDGDKLAAEPLYWNGILDSVTPWTLPLSSPRGGFRLLGYMRAREITDAADPADNRAGWEIWTGLNASPKPNVDFATPARLSGGTQHACEMSYLDGGRIFDLTPVTSQSGTVQVLRGEANRLFTLTAGTPLHIDMGVAPTITSAADVGFTHEWRADTGITLSVADVVTWDENAGFGALQWGSPGGGRPEVTKPTMGTDANGNTYVKLVAASALAGQGLTLNSLLVNPTQDFTVVLVSHVTSTVGVQRIFDLASHTNASQLTVFAYSGVDDILFLDTAGTNITTEMGGHTWAGDSLPKMIVLMRRNNVLYESFEYVGASRSAWRTSAINTGKTFTTSGTVSSALGCEWTTAGGQYYQFTTGAILYVAAKQAASDEADLDAMRVHLETFITF